MNKTGLLLAALGSGLVLGLLANTQAGAFLGGWIDAVQPLGRLWVRGLTMTLVPLVFSLVVTGVCNAVRHGAGGRLIGLSFAVFAPMLALGVLAAITAVELVLWLFPLGPHPLAGLVGIDSTPAAPVLPKTGEILLAFLPENPIAAAASGQMLPLVLFGMLLGAALAKLPPQADGRPATLPALFADLAHAMTRIVEWVLLAAPVGVFVLALNVAKGAGASVAGVLARYVAAQTVSCLLIVTLCYVLVVVLRAMPPGRFARGILPAQATAAGTCSSLATAPVTMECAIARLDLPEEVSGATLPLAVTSFRMATAGASALGAFLAAHAAEVHAPLSHWVMAAVSAFLAGIAMPGLPAAAMIYASTAPGMQVLGAPVALIPLFIAVIAIPDVLVTVANVTAHLTSATLVARLAERPRFRFARR